VGWGASACINRELSPVHIDGIGMEHAESEDRTHDLRIMRSTRYQLRYFRPAGSSKSVAIHVVLLEAAARNLSCICDCLLLFLRLHP
jgi:hypothetical protein